MRFLIITHVKHLRQDDGFFAYAPYVREMNIWLKHVDEVEIVAPLTNYTKTDIDLGYNHAHIRFNSIPEIEFTSLFKILTSIFKSPNILFKIFKACQRADHIHLRCPGNIGLLGCLVQILFPKKVKTAKYAGNWDSDSKQPFSYRFQKKILSNIFLTKNMQALVYGDWKNQTKNIKPFFTATYKRGEAEFIEEKNYKGNLNFLFIGSLVNGKNPLLCIQIIEELNRKGIKASLDLFGDGDLKDLLQNYIDDNRLGSYINIRGNVTNLVIKEAYKSSHFLLLPSKSEGWPKAVAEAMFFGVIPVATDISCVRWMLDDGRRGVLIEDDLPKAVEKILKRIKSDNLTLMSIASQNWSQKYTMDLFEEEIIKLLRFR